MSVDVYGLCKVGKVRELNEDYFSARSFAKDDLLCIVADGMGGHNAGEIASRMAVESIEKKLIPSISDSGNPNNLLYELEIAFKAANFEIFSESVSNIYENGMGTTCVACIFRRNMVYTANVGDSRAYLIRNDSISQITHDHSIVQELIDSNNISPGEADQHPQKHVITRALGTDGEVDIDLFQNELSKGDIIILCSDGLNNVLKDSEILDISRKCSNAEQITSELISETYNRGAPDNVTVIAAIYR